MIAGKTFGRGTFVTAALLTLLGGAVGRSDAAALSLSGEINPGKTSFTIAELEGLPSISATGKDGNEYVGASLWAFLDNGSRIIQTPTPVPPIGSDNNPILSRYGMATGADGRMSLLSAGEINTNFGAPTIVPSTPYPYLLAYSQNGASLATPKLVVLDDPTGMRNVMNLVNLDVRNVVRPIAGPQVPSTEFTLTGTNGTAKHDITTLKALPPTTVLRGHFTRNSPLLRISFALDESQLVALADGISTHEAEAFAPELRGH